MRLFISKAFFSNRVVLRIGIGMICILSSFLIFFCLNRPTADEDVFSFSSYYKERPVSLQASYWEVEDAEYAVLICPGYSCDRQKWRPFADLFVENGFSTMVFDYAGQGASSDTIGFDNAKTDAIPLEIDDAIEELSKRSGIDYEHIILMGHSMGGRSILRLLYDYNNVDTGLTIQRKQIKNVILFSPEVNYDYSAQASLFAGTRDDLEEPWKSFSPADVAGCNVFLFGSTADDVVSAGCMYGIGRHLGMADLPVSGTFDGKTVNSFGDTITIGVTSGVLHSYQMYSPKFAAYVNQALEEISGRRSVYNIDNMSLIYIGWLLALLGIGLVLRGLTWNLGDSLDFGDSSDFAFSSDFGNSLNIKSTPDELLPLELVDAKCFLIQKLLMWIPGILLAFAVCCICVVLPFGSPIMNIPYMCFVSGYGIAMFLAYRRGNFKGTRGKLPKLFLRNSDSKSFDFKEFFSGVFVCMLLCAFVWYVMRATMYRLIPCNMRLFWVVFAGILMTVGFFVSGVEADMLKASGVSIKIVIFYNLIQYVALFLFVLFYLVIKSYSGVIGQAQNMLLLYIFCIPMGDYLRKKSGSRLLGAFTSGILFQLLMITSAALIAVV